MMKRTVLALFVVAGLCVTGYLMAGDNADKKGCPISAAAKASGGSCCAGKAGALAAYPSYQRANELLKSWQEVPAKLAALTDTDKSELMAAAEKMHKIHPAASAFQPTMAFLTEGMTTLASIDAAAAKLCSESCKGQAKTASAEGAAEAKAGCPVAAAALASAKEKMEKSAALLAKANEVLTLVSNPGEGGCSGKTACADSAAKLASATEKSGCCAEKKATLTASEAKPSCAGEKASLASAEKKGECAEKAALASAEKGACTEKAALASAEKKGECAEKAALASAEKGACTEKAALASAEKKGECTQTAALAAADQPVCVKSISAKADAVVARSGAILAQWQGAGIQLTAVDGADRQEIEKVTQVVLTRCPKGQRMPETLDTVAALLRDAAMLSAQARMECQKNESLAKMVPAEALQLCQARTAVIAAMINVLEKSNNTIRPVRQVAAAQ